MGKKQAKRSDPKEREPTTSPQSSEMAHDNLIDPAIVRQHIKLYGPEEYPPPPAPRPGYVTLFDPGLSIAELRGSHPPHFYRNDWYRGLPFAKQWEPMVWRQLRMTPIPAGKPFLDQTESLLPGEAPISARVVVLFLLLRHLITKEYPDIGRLRCSDILPSGQRVLVGPFGPRGIELASCSDRYASPSVSLSAAFSFDPPRKKRK